MTQESLFSSGSELANLVVASDVLHHSWDAILELDRDTNPYDLPSLHLTVKYKVFPQQEQNHTILAFETSPICTRQHLQERDLVSSATLKETYPFFEFLCTKKNPSFSIHKTAVTLFGTLRYELPLLKNQLISCAPLIITGHSLGGSIASLFTLWLLESMDPKTTKRPLCVTFGSPLLGDNGLRKSILEHSAWNSCFIHVASSEDSIPRLLISPDNPSAAYPTFRNTIGYKPFGTFLLCSESGCACYEDSESISDLLVAMHSDTNEGLQAFDYTDTVKLLKNKVLVKGISELGERITHPLRAGFLTQLRTIGFTRSQRHQQNIDINSLVVKMEKMEEKSVMRKRRVFDPSKKLNDMKIYMAYLEWYKKESEAQSFGYYDRYKNKWSTSDIDVSKYKKKLTNYWKDMVAEADKKPQKEGASFRTRWLYAGTNYRRMVEPLEIADYYYKERRSKKEYKTQGRFKHYIRLEQWQKGDIERPRNANGRKSASLTEDSCFWAHVEEASLSCELFKSGGDSSAEDKTSSWEKLIAFEGYVMDLINDYAVSSEIFLDKSSFMHLWREFEEIAEEMSHKENCRRKLPKKCLLIYMKNHEYRNYA